ncbi:MAG: hypothetical protein ORO03_07720 [Alphaproteobacteria bacterium]|nr:hypothetical protein [Alphaproteobacteria bacterium]
MDIKTVAHEYQRALQPRPLAGSHIQTYDKQNANAASAAITLEAAKSASPLTSSSSNTGLVASKTA